MNNISFISAFRKFKGPHDMIQSSALYSWKANNIKVIAPLNEIGLKEKLAGWDNVITIDNVLRARELGFSNQCPIVKDLIEKALPLVDTPMVAFINSDIIIEEDFSKKFKKIVDKYGYDVYMVGTRKDIELKEYVNSPESYKRVLSQKRSSYDDSTSSDMFIASKFLWRKIVSEMPEFILGRYCWDNWLHMYAEIHQLKKKNCSEALPILHCQHNYEHIKLQEGAKERAAPSSKYNAQLWEKVRGVYGTTRVKYWPPIEI